MDIERLIKIIAKDIKDGDKKIKPFIPHIRKIKIKRIYGR